MHPDARQAVLAMLNGIEQQLATIRGIIANADDAQVAQAQLRAPVQPKKQQQQPRAYLTDEEEATLADELGITEVERLAQAAETAIPGQQTAVQSLMHQALAGLSPYSDEQRNAAFLRGTMGG